MSEIVEDLSKTHGKVVITHNGEARAVLQGMESYEEMQDSLAMLKIVAMSTKKATLQGKGQTVEKAFSDVRRRAKRSGVQMRRTVVILPEAKEDLIDIYLYAAEHESAVRADALLDGLEEKCASLRSFPMRGHTVPELKRIHVESYRENISDPIESYFRLPMKTSTFMGSSTEEENCRSCRKEG